MCKIRLLSTVMACLTAASVSNAVELKTRPFNLSQVRLLDGPFLHAMKLNRESLLRYEPDRLLAKYRIEAGLKPRAEHYKGWESNTVAGFSLGHYLSACAITYAATDETQFLDRANRIVDELDECQQADASGYIGAPPNAKQIFEEQIALGKIDSKGFGLNGLWVPLYTQHKLMAGLRDAYHLCDNPKALEIERKLGLWFDKVFSRLNDEQIQKMLHCEHGGINEVFADLYADTKDERFLELSRKMHHKVVLEPLANGIDCLPGLHANTQVPKLIGLARRYELTNDASDKKAAAFFWDRVAHHHSYTTGGHCINEYFGPPDTLSDRLGPNTTETCNVYNMLKLTRHVFGWTGSSRVADFYERALFNHILSSQHPDDGRVIYNLTIEMGGYKRYQDPYGFTCCVGTGMENHSKYGDSIYFHNDRELYVNLFIASELTWKEKGITLRQETRFPDEQSTSLQFTCEKPVEMALRIRKPYWAEKGISIRLNGKKEEIFQSDQTGFLELKRTWQTGDRVEIDMPFTLRLESMPDNPNRVSVMHGPLVLAGDLGPVDNPEAGSPWFVPVLLTDGRDPAEWLSPVEGSSNTFKTSDVGQPRDVTLRPFYQTHDRRYSIFWDLFTQVEWERHQAEYQAELERRKKLEAMTIDFVQPGEMQPERDHNMQGEHTGAGQHKGRKWRHAPGGWFSFDMKVSPDEPIRLQATYWGDESIRREFDVLVDGKKIATQKLARDHPGEFFDVDYLIPPELTREKDRITVRFEAHPKSIAGGLFGLRVLTLKKKP